MEQKDFDNMISFLKMKQDKDQIIEADVDNVSGGTVFFNDLPLTQKSGFLKITILVK